MVVGAALGGAFAYVHSTEPAWYVRLRYPLRYDVTSASISDKAALYSCLSDQGVRVNEVRTGD